MAPADTPGSASVKYAPHTPLRAALLKRIEEYFDRTGRSRQGGPRMWVKTSMILAWLAVSYALLVFWADAWWQVVPLTISMALAVAGVGFNIQHDGGHGAYSRRKFGNRLSSWSLDLVGASSYVWNFKHNVLHHHYTNIQGVDTDLESEPFLRLAPGQKRRWYHRFQHFYIWGLLGFFPPKWWFFDDFRDVLRGRVGSRKIPRPRGGELVVLLAGKVLMITWLIVLPVLIHGPLKVLPVYVLFFATLGITLATVFQLAHCVDDADFCEVPGEDGRMDSGWAEHQLATTVNFAPRNRWLTWYLGGLNFQVEHHLFPRISHVHYPALAPITREVCREHGVPHHSHDSMWSALRAHVRWLREMGRPAPRS